VRVLVVDDDPSVRALIRATLEDRLDVVEAANGEAALTILRAGNVDAVLLDVMMPGIDGFEVLSRIRRGETNADVAVVMLTARVGESDHVRAFKSGADAYLTKPFDVDDLLECVQQVAKTTPSDRLNERQRLLGRAELLRQIEQRFAS